MTLAITCWLFLLTLHVHSAKELVNAVGDDRRLQNLSLRTTPLSKWDIPPPGVPYFETGPGPLNLTVQLGSRITLHCKVNQLADKIAVSWLRREGEKLKLVSVGLDPYSNEPRYTTLYSEPNDWQLRLDRVQHSDQGQYECHVSSHPPISLSFFLTVVVPELVIQDERGLEIRNKFYNSGSTIELKCIISKLPEPSHFIIWRHGDRMLNYDTTRGGISVKTDVLEDGANSRLYIANAGPHDSGNYTCALSEITNSTVTVVVLNGKEGEAPAAMHVGGCTKISSLHIVRLMMFVSISVSSSCLHQMGTR